MLYGLLVACFVMNALFLVLLILIQQTKSSMGLGAMGGGSQMLFGGSGGQTIFQKATWVLGATFMGLSLFLSLMKSGGYGGNYLQNIEKARLAREEQAQGKQAAETTKADDVQTEQTSDKETAQ